MSEIEERVVCGQWYPIATAPRDGTPILLLSRAHDVDMPAAAFEEGPARAVHYEAKVHIGHWWPDATAWVDEYGRLDGESYELKQTGVWSSDGVATKLLVLA